MKIFLKKKISVCFCILLSAILFTGCASPISMAMKMYEVYAAKQEYEREMADNQYPEEYGEYQAEEDGEEAVETVMIYMVGSNLESDYGNATADLEEIIEAGIDTKHNNIVVYTGGASDWEMDGIPSGKNCTLLLNEDNEFDIIDSSMAKSMGEADTLSSFINYCFEKFPSEHYGLILWDHGAGPVYGFGLDENFSDVLMMDELQEALKDSVGKENTHLEWVGFDACLMNSMEIASLMAPYADYMIASQETEPGWGWDYSFLAVLSDETLSGEEMGRAVIDQYMNYSEAVFDYYPRMYCDLTMSCIDLTKYEKAEKAVNDCFGSLNEQLNLETYPELVRKRENARDFGTYSTDFDYGMVDMVHLLSQIAANFQEAENAIEAIEDMVVYSKSNMKNANGISICYPYLTDDDYTTSYMDVQKEMKFAPAYTGFLEKFYSIQNGDELVKDWDFSKNKAGVSHVEAGGIAGETGQTVTVDTSEITLQLTDEQADNFSGADFFILCNVEGAGFLEKGEDARGDEMYMFIHLGKNVVLDENGKLHGYYGNQAMYIYDETEKTYSPIPMILMEEKEQPENEIRYSCMGVLSNFNLEDTDNWVIESVNMQIVVNDEYPNGMIRNAVPLSDEETDNNSPSKQLLDLKDFGIMEIVSRGSYFTRGENGEMINFFDWEHSGTLFGISQDLTNGYHLELRPLENKENYYCVFRIKDIQGNVSYSEMIPLQN